VADLDEAGGQYVQEKSTHELDDFNRRGISVPSTTSQGF
jgi:hypothetical protein